jgi:hypothetical protein
MTREEFMDIVYSELHSDGDNYRANRIIDAADEYVETEKESNWIPVSERLPEYDNDVLATDGENIYVAYYWNKYWNSNDDRCCLELPVKAWMPLPKPYEEKTE